MARRLRLGIIGTLPGRRRWQAALASLRHEARIVAVHSPGREDSTAEGVLETLRQPSLDAVLLGEAWFGLWPLPHALEAGVPVLCLAPPEDSALPLLGDSPRVRFLPWPALSFAASALGGVLEELGPARLVQAAWTHPVSGPPLDHPRALALLLLAESLLGTPVNAHVVGDGPTCVLLDHGEGRWSQLALADAPHPACRISVQAEGGCASLELPNRLSWRDGAAQHERRLPPMAEAAVLEAFFRDVRAGGPADSPPSLERLLARNSGG